MDRRHRGAPTAFADTGDRTGPVSNDMVTLTFKQAIGAAGSLRTASYSRTLTFTLASTSP